MNNKWMKMIRVPLVALAYFFVHAVVGLSLGQGQVAPLVEMESGIWLAVFLLCPRKLWPQLAPALLVGGVCAEILWFDKFFWTAVGHLFGHVFVAFVTACLIDRWADGGSDGDNSNSKKDAKKDALTKVRFNRSREVVALIVGAFFVNALGAFIVAATSTLMEEGVQFTKIWSYWFGSNGVGILVVAPIIVIWINPKETFHYMTYMRDNLRRLLELLAILLVWGLVALTNFYDFTKECGLLLDPHPYLLVALVLFPANRFGNRGVTLALLILMVISALSPSFVAGKFTPWPNSINMSAQEKILEMQLFCSSIAIVGLLFAANVFESKSAEQGIKNSTIDLQQALESSHRSRKALLSIAADQRATEEKLRIAKERAEAANKAKSEFLANVSHDIRTPLHAIMGFVSILKSKEDRNRQEQKIIDIIQKKSVELSSLVEEILDISKVETGRVSLRDEIFNLKELIVDIVESSKLEIEEKKIQITHIFKGDIELVRGDGGRIGQIISNLVQNAIKYSDEGNILLSSECLPLSVLDSNQNHMCLFKFSVSDMGLGIEEDKLELIFEPFARLHEFSGGKRRSGTGLGLYIVKIQLDSMGGRIWVSSKVGVGSLFSFEVKLGIA